RQSERRGATMKCFNHREADALAVCKHCCRALCHECVAEIQGAVSCRGDCEKHVAAFVRWSVQVSRRTGGALLTNGMALLLLSPVCASVGWVIHSHEDETLRKLKVVMYALAALCFLAALPFFFFAWGFSRKATAARDDGSFRRSPDA